MLKQTLVEFTVRDVTHKDPLLTVDFAAACQRAWQTSGRPVRVEHSPDQRTLTIKICRSQDVLWATSKVRVLLRLLHDPVTRQEAAVEMVGEVLSTS